MDWTTICYNLFMPLDVPFFFSPYFCASLRKLLRNHYRKCIPSTNILWRQAASMHCSAYSLCSMEASFCYLAPRWWLCGRERCCCEMSLSAFMDDKWTLIKIINHLRLPLLFSCCFVVVRTCVWVYMCVWGHFLPSLFQPRCDQVVKNNALFSFPSLVLPLPKENVRTNDFFSFSFLPSFPGIE